MKVMATAPFATTCVEYVTNVSISKKRPTSKRLVWLTFNQLPPISNVVMPANTTVFPQFKAYLWKRKQSERKSEIWKNLLWIIWQCGARSVTVMMSGH